MGGWRVAVLALSLALLSLTFSVWDGPGSPDSTMASGALRVSASADVSENRMGDTDCSGTVTSVDALQVLRGVAGIGAPAQCLGTAGDTDCDSERDSVDALRILRHVASLTVVAPAGCTPIGEALGGGTPTPSPPALSTWSGTLSFDRQVDISHGFGQCYTRQETVDFDVADAVFAFDTLDGHAQVHKLESGHITYTYDMHEVLEYDPDRLCYNIARDCTAHVEASLEVTPGMSELWIIESQEGATYVLSSETAVEIRATPDCSIGEGDEEALGVAPALSLVNEYDGSNHLAGTYTAGNSNETNTWTWDLHRSGPAPALERR